MDDEYVESITLNSEILLRDCWKYNQKHLTLRPFSHKRGKAFLLKLSIDHTSSEDDNVGRCTIYITHWVMEGYHPTPAYLIKTKLMEDTPRNILVHGNSRNWQELGQVDYTSHNFCVPLEVSILYKAEIADNLSRMQDLFPLDEFLDFSLVCEDPDDGSVMIHGAVMACRNWQWFNLDDRTEGSFTVATANLATLQAFKGFLYTGDVSEEDVDGLMKVAKHYDINELESKCIARKYQMVTVDNVLEKLEEARVSGCNALVDAIMLFMKIHPPGSQQGSSDIKSSSTGNNRQYRGQINYELKKSNEKIATLVVRPFLEDGGENFYISIDYHGNYFAVNIAYWALEVHDTRKLMDIHYELKVEDITVSQNIVIESGKSNSSSLYAFDCFCNGTGTGTYVIDVAIEVLDEIMLPQLPAFGEKLSTITISQHVFKNFHLIASSFGKDAHIDAVIFALKSDVFRKMMNEKSEEIKDMDLQVELQGTSLGYFADYLYSGEIYDYIHVKSVLKMADKFNMEDVKRKCLSKMYDDVTVSNALDKLSLARKRGHAELVEAILEFVMENLEEFLTDKEEIGHAAGPYCNKLS